MLISILAAVALGVALPCALYAATGNVARALVGVALVLLVVVAGLAMRVDAEWRILGAWLARDDARLAVSVAGVGPPLAFELVAAGADFRVPDGHGTATHPAPPARRLAVRASSDLALDRPSLSLALVNLVRRIPNVDPVVEYVPALGARSAGS